MMRYAVAFMTLFWIGSSGELCLAGVCKGISAADDRKVALYRTSRQIQLGQLHIIAVGSAFTLGDAEWREERSYPASLENKLRKRMPQVKIHVLNAGRDGATVREMLSVIQQYLEAAVPGLVIWQVGPVDAIRDTGVELFQEALRQGIAAIRQAGADVVLIDLPYGPEPDRYRALQEYENVIVATAREKNVGLISVYSRMVRPFSTTKAGSPYECVADLIADYITGGLRAVNAQPMSSVLYSNNATMPR